MSYCREGHTLVDNEAEANWDKLPPGSFFELVVLAVTYFGIVDEYIPPTPTTLVCRLYTDSGRTILHTVDIGLGSVYEINNGVDYLHDQLDLQLNDSGGMGVWRSPTVTIRDDTGVWGGEWVAEPKPDELVQFNFDGIHTLFKVSVESPLATEVAGAGLGAGTFQYCIVPVDGSGRLGAGSRVLTVTLAGAADILIDWLPNTQVTTWNVYGRLSGALFGLMVNLPGATVSLTDDGTLVPDPNFQPPLFEDPAWTVAVANRQVVATDGDVDFDATGNEDGVTKNDDGSSVATFTAVGDVDADNTALNTSYLLTGLVSHSNGRLDIVVDPTLFSNDTGPLESLPPKVTTYDYHVFIDSNGDTVIQEADSFTGQTTVIIVNTTDNTFDITISDSTGVLATDSKPITAAFTIPTPGSLSAEITLSNFRTLTDGTIIADETITANTYDVVPQAVVGFQFLSHQNFGTPTQQDVAFTADGWATSTVFTVPGTRWTLPPGFTRNRIPFISAHGHGWTVMCSVDHPTIPNSVNDFALHWTPDLSLASWPFNDAGGRVAGGMTVAQFEIIMRFTTGSSDNTHFQIYKAANGLGPFMQRNCDVHDQQRFPFNAGEEDIDFFFPATNTFTFQDPGAVHYNYTMIWEEKSILIGLAEGAINNIWVNPLTTNESAPLGVQDFKTAVTVPFTPNRVLRMGTTRDLAYIIWKVGSIIGVSTSPDGSVWNTFQLNNTNDLDPRNVGNEWVGMPPGTSGDPKRDGVMIYPMDTDELQYSLDNGTTWLRTTVKALAFWDGWGYFPWLHGEGDFVLMYTPIMWDGTVMGVPGPNGGVVPTIRRHDGTLPNMTDLVPDTGPDPGWGSVSDVSINYGQTIGSSATPEGIPGANLRRYLGRSVVIPTGVANMPAPFVIRDTTKTAVYDSRRTNVREVNYGGMRGTITTGPGGLSNDQVAIIENGQEIIISIPGSSDAVMAAKNPIPVNMKWTPIIPF